MKRGHPALPLADAAALAAAARRTAAVRAGLALALLAAIAAGYLLVPGAGGARAHAAGGSGTVVVLDVSGSIEDEAQSKLIRRLLTEEKAAAGANGRVGLVLFSDTAFEALPPSAPASALDGYRRFFVPVPGRRRAPFPGARPQPVYPTSPWALFTGGTAISRGLREARQALGRAGLDGGTVLLVSDLVDGPQDRPALRKELAAYTGDPHLDLQVRVLPSGLPQATARFRKDFGRDAVRAAAVPVAAPAAPTGRLLPLWLIAAAALAAVALAAHELLAAPLRWRQMEDGSGGRPGPGTPNASRREAPA